MPMKQKLELMRCSKVLVPLFLQVLYYSKEEGKEERKEGRGKERDRGWTGKRRRRRRGREGKKRR